MLELIFSLITVTVVDFMINCDNNNKNIKHLNSKYYLIKLLYHS